MKRFLALLLILALSLSLLPMTFAAKTETPSTEPLKEENYALADLMWEEINTKEESMLAKKAPVSHTVEALIATVTASPYYEEDSLIRNGDHFFWETTDGIACGYSPRLSALAREEAGQDEREASTSPDISSDTRKNSTTGKNVYLFQPYYGLDRDFTTQYVTEAQRIAKALGGTATTYRTTDATIDAIANAMEEGAVIIFDSHGDTDYVNPNDADDFATRANTSYICLQSNEGITLDDMQVVSGSFGSYYHAYYAGNYGQMKYYCVDGTAIANHMDKNAPNNLLWMALCLSMTTDGLHAPLMKKGVGVAYGYSQSVTFDYDYAWEEVFWENMIANSTVATAVAAMKEEVGLWDWCHSSSYDSLWEAREYYCAFPIVVSAQDPYPGHGKVDDYQTVRSTWVLNNNCSHSNVAYYPEVPATCHETGTTAYYQCSSCNTYFADQELKTILTWEQILIPRMEHDYTDNATVVPPTCTTEGYTLHTCKLCGNTYTSDTVPATGHSLASAAFAPTCSTEGYISYICLFCDYSYKEIVAPASGHAYEEGVCTLCGKLDLPENPFTDVNESEYFGIPVLWALKMNITTGTTATTFGPENTCTRGQVVTFLWRANGCPEPTTAENPFVDISPNAYYYKAVLWAVENGITQGTGRGKFSPDSGCTRGQVATFLWRAQGEPAPVESNNPFSDVSESDYYYTAVLWAVENSITQGTGKDKFSPDKDCTRGQIVTFLYRAIA